jgi:hypothetical protein
MEFSMNRPDDAPAFGKPPSRHRRVAALAIGCVLFTISSYGFAQITSGNGSQQQDNRASSMGTTPDPASSAVHESNAPQAKEAKAGARGKTQGKDHKPSGAGGFDNGLYGTGAGSNK